MRLELGAHGRKRLPMHGPFDPVKLGVYLGEERFRSRQESCSSRCIPGRGGWSVSTGARRAPQASASAGAARTGGEYRPNQLRHRGVEHSRLVHERLVAGFLEPDELLRRCGQGIDVDQAGLHRDPVIVARGRRTPAPAPRAPARSGSGARPQSTSRRARSGSRAGRRADRGSRLPAAERRAGERPQRLRPHAALEPRQQRALRPQALGGVCRPADRSQLLRRPALAEALRFGKRERVGGRLGSCPVADLPTVDVRLDLLGERAA
jgi:hypothetical protein